MIKFLGLLIVALSCLTQFSQATFTPNIVDIDSYILLRTCNQSSLYLVNSSASDYVYQPYLIDLHGSYYQQGYDYGYMLAVEIDATYNTFLQSLIGPAWYDIEVAELIGRALDWQWNDYLSKELPAQYHEELRGIAAGSADMGYPLAYKQVTRVIVLANAPGDVGDFILILIREFLGDEIADRLSSLFPPKVEPFRGFCSMFAIWGSRTQNKELFTGRNLDWNANTGVNQFKVVVVYHPPNGGIPHATIGYIGVWGALTGMSAAGLTVHEANLEENEITFGGFAWLLRLRYVMEYAHNTSEAYQIWKTTNNTVGFNHMVASAPDARVYAAGQPVQVGVALIMETMYEYTAYFTDNDPREANATYLPANSSTPIKIGFPLPEAVWRTNHGYDPTIRQHYEWSQSPDSWSNVRYVMIHDALLDYQNRGIAIGLKEAVNISAIAGDKGSGHPYVCEENTDGSNVISVGYAPTDLVMAVAWERNHGQAWRPATCSSYITFDMKRWFNNAAKTQTSSP